MSSLPPLRTALGHRSQVAGRRSQIAECCHPDRAAGHEHAAMIPRMVYRLAERAGRRDASSRLCYNLAPDDALLSAAQIAKLFGGGVGAASPPPHPHHWGGLEGAPRGYPGPSRPPQLPSLAAYAAVNRSWEPGDSVSNGQAGVLVGAATRLRPAP